MTRPSPTRRLRNHDAPPSPRLARLLVSCLVTLLGHQLAPAPARAANEVVTNCTSDADLVAKLAALDVAGGGTLTFACGANPVAIVVQQPLAIGANPVTIDGGGKITLSGGNTVGVLDVAAGRALVLKRMTVTRGSSLCGAVCLGDGARLKATQVDFRENTSSASGGAVYATAGAKIRLKRCKLADNTAAASGGAIASIGANVTVLISSFEGNQAGQFGAAIYADHATTFTKRATFSSNVAGWDGGGIYVNRGTLTVRRGAFAANEATAFEGGAIANVNGDVSVRDVEFFLNTAGLRGGAISSKGVLFPDEIGVLKVERSRFDTNTAGLQGGTIYSKAFAYLTDVEIKDGQAADGGGVLTETYELEVTRCLLHGNSVTSAGRGGAIRSIGSLLTLTNSTFAQNAARYGGGLDHSGAAGSIANCTFTGNTAGAFGGANVVTGDGVPGLTLTNTILANDASSEVGCAQSSPGSIVSGGHNIVFTFTGDTSCPIVGSDLTDDPLLGMLEVQGGRIASVAPQTGSPAIDGGTGTGCPATDQRGFDRPQGLACDIGATERCDAKPASPVQVFPDDGTTQPATTARFAWDAVACAERYQLELRTGSPSGAPFLVVDTFSYDLGQTVLLAPGTYAWRARACNVLGCRNSPWRTVVAQ